MTSKEIEDLIKSEKQQLEAFLKISKQFKLPPEVVEQQINLYLDKIAELLKKLK